MTTTGDLRLAALVLAAGASSRFGGPKLIAPLAGRPLLQHVLDTVAAEHPAGVVVVLGHHADAIRSAIRWRDEIVILNPDPSRGLASSLRVGLAAIEALDPSPDGTFVLLGDQPRVSLDVLDALRVAAAREARAHRVAHPVVVPRYAADGGPNPCLLLRESWPLARSLTGDRGMGPLIAARPGLALRVPVPGTNPDVDSEDDLAALQARPEAG
jgi:molybdenum cofactor cytidylyltransferase